MGVRVWICAMHICFHTLALNDTRLNSYSVSSDPLVIGPEPSMDYPLDNPSDLTRAREQAGSLRLAFEQRFRSLEV